MRRAVALAVGSLLLGLPAVASAAWSGSATGSAVTAAATMANAPDFRARCTNKSASSSVTLEWTISPDLYVSGYRILRTSSAGDVVPIDIPGRTTAKHVDSPMQTNGLVFTYTISAVAAPTSWTTAPSAATGSPSYTGNRGACVTA